MDYHIEVKNSKNKWEKVVSCQSFQDRDVCLSALKENFSDCEFRPVDD
jgi:hypothetical protein